MPDNALIDREISWLSFNYRVLQEAQDKRTPLLERLKFLAIYSSNLDEFYRVRVAGIKHLLDDQNESRSARRLLKDIQRTVSKYLDAFGHTFWKEIKPLLEEEGIFIVDEKNLTTEQEKFVQEYFEEQVKFFIQPGLMAQGKIAHFLKNNVLYLILQLSNKNKPNSNKYRYAFIEIPSTQLSRFVEIPSAGDTHYVMFLDDLIRFNLPDIFIGYTIKGIYSVKLTRDADLYIEDEFSGSILKKIRKSLHRRDIGQASRFLYDGKMPTPMLSYLQTCFNLNAADMVRGGRYHNFSAFFRFPTFNRSDLLYEPMETLNISEIDEADSMFKLIRKKDLFVAYPYHSYNYIIRFLNEAVFDRSVTEIFITLYRVADNSQIVDALCRAATDGIKVNVFVELKARFDEVSNITASERLTEAGANVRLSIPRIKVHSKLCMIGRNEDGVVHYYTYLATGNFNEKTSKIYSDLAIFTYNKGFAKDLLKLFDYLMNQNESVQFKNLWVAPFNLRSSVENAIDTEIESAKAGNKSYIIMKMNSLEDPKMVNKLYQASQKGVKIKLIVRGICCLNPGVKGLSERIEVISIVDRFLEHSRVFIFANNGDPKIYLGSADLMKRNLYRRVEILFPVENPRIKEIIQKLIDLQLSDNVKARRLTADFSNEYVKKGKKAIRSQYAVYDFLKAQKSNPKPK
ncbi:MAG: polyphosphate kinase 1 [Calditrichaeota bacterium]|nr:polyphosphate kinase 1 [Calditrichota bacterium]